MRILIGAGGTGGHVYPALATAQALLHDNEAAPKLYFIGALGGMERKLVAESGLDFDGYHEVLAGPVHGVNPVRIISSLIKLKLGSIQAFTHLRAIRPRVILLTGGWANLPVALSARLLRIPTVIYLPDIEPGLTIKALQPFAQKVAITVASSARFFPRDKTVVTGYPLLDSRLAADKARGLTYFGLDPDRKTLLAFGGSRGARNINIALEKHMAQLLASGIQVIHITGELDWERSQRQLGVLADHNHYHAFAYLHEQMGLAFAAADLALCRAGASTLAELPLFGLPAILVPYPYAWRYQKVNADYLAERGAAVRLNDEDMSEKLYDTVSGLMLDEARLKEMRAKSQALANPNGARRLADLLRQIGRG